MFDKTKFKEAVTRSGLKGTFIAEGLGMSYNLFLQKSNGLAQWKVDEVMTFSQMLRLRKPERDAIFFAKEVTKMGTSSGQEGGEQ